MSISVMPTNASLGQSTISAAAAPERSHPVRDQLKLTVVEHRAALLSKAICLTGNRDDANDLVQDALVRGMRAIDTFRPGTNMKAWLMRILVNRFLDRCRERRCRPVHESLESALRMQTMVEPQVEEETVPLSARVTREQLEAALAQLEPIFRSVYELRVVRQLSYVQIARELNVPLPTVGTRLLRARKQLCRILTPSPQGPEPEER
jgi:RNA polymerase sigma-70 factor (ECF subfamily)